MHVARKMDALPGLAISWTAELSEVEMLQGEWQGLVILSQPELYLSADWLVPWWQHFGQRRRLTCMVARQDGVLVGFLPFCIETIWLGPLPVRIARLAGTDPHCMVFALPLAPEFAAGLLAAAFDHLLQDMRCATVSFTPVSDRAPFLKTIQQFAAPRSDIAVVDMPLGSHVIFDLPDSFAEFLSTRLSKKRRSQFRRDVAGLEEKFGMQGLRTVPDRAAFEAFVHFHNQQWTAVGKGGHFADWPGSAGFYQDVTARSSEGRGVNFFLLNGTDGPLAAQLALVSEQTCHWRLPARALDPELERLSIGKAGLLMMIKQLIEGGVRMIEAGRGEYDYKLAYGGESVPVHRLLVSRSALTARIRLRLLLGWADILNLLYYRIWFLKLAPRLRRLTGGKPRPLWRAWIRTRL